MALDPQISPSLSKAETSGPSAPPRSPRNGSSSFSDSSESNKDVASEMSSDSNSPAPGQTVSRPNVSIHKGCCPVNLASCNELPDLRTPSMGVSPSCPGKDVSVATLLALTEAEPVPVCKPPLTK
ncbi:hypothetical protein NL676_018884 [Syzygium grande]|nr:hypothetical protein NL676_018884 [Syzygium grande]